MADKLEEALVKHYTHVNSFYGILLLPLPKVPTCYWIKNIAHAIAIFPDGFVFNCDPRDYPLDLMGFKHLTMSRQQIEPDISTYETYWEKDTSFGTMPYLENDSNCILWTSYYVWWRETRTTDNQDFPSSLEDLEDWCKQQ